MLVSPAEPVDLRALGKTSSTPERFGADFLFPSVSFGAIGVQRKEVNDLVASVHDGRLQKELVQMRGLGLGVVVIEGRVKWTDDGFAMMNGQWTGRAGTRTGKTQQATRDWTYAAHQSTMWSIQSAGYWIANVADRGECILWLSHFERWAAKERHSILGNRPKAKGAWGKADNREWGVHLLQSFQGVGRGVAEKVYDHFGGVPMQWTVGVEGLMDVEGIGKVRAREMIGALKEVAMDEPYVELEEE